MTKKLGRTMALAAALTFGAVGAQATENRETEYNDSLMHPLSLAGYAAHPIGYAAEWLIGRPIQFIISRPGLDKIFGYRSKEDPESFRRYGESL